MLIFSVTDVHWLPLLIVLGVLILSFHVLALLHGCRAQYCKLIRLFEVYCSIESEQLSQRFSFCLACMFLDSSYGYYWETWLIFSMLYRISWWTCHLMICEAKGHFWLSDRLPCSVNFLLKNKNTKSFNQQQ